MLQNFLRNWSGTATGCNCYQYPAWWSPTASLLTHVDVRPLPKRHSCERGGGTDRPMDSGGLRGYFSKKNAKTSRTHQTPTGYRLHFFLLWCCWSWKYCYWSSRMVCVIHIHTSASHYRQCNRNLSAIRASILQVYVTWFTANRLENSAKNRCNFLLVHFLLVQPNCKHILSFNKKRWFRDKTCVWNSPALPWATDTRCRRFNHWPVSCLTSKGIQLSLIFHDLLKPGLLERPG